MSLKDSLKKVAHLSAVVYSLSTMPAADASEKQTPPIQKTSVVSVEKKSVEELEARVNRGVIINGEPESEKTAKLQAIKKEKGIQAALDAIPRDPIEEIEIPKKDEDGYTFLTIRPGKEDVIESYYPNGVLKMKTDKDGQLTEFYSDGSRKATKTADGVKTHYYPGGELGKEKIKETPHKEYEAYDVLDENGQRIEHHYAIEESIRQTDGGVITSPDIKKVDLYNPQTQQLEGTYTLDNWHVDEGHIKSIGFVDDNGKMKTMNFSPSQKIGDSSYYTDSLTVEQIKEIYDDELQYRTQQQNLQKNKFNRMFDK